MTLWNKIRKFLNLKYEIIFLPDEVNNTLNTLNNSRRVISSKQLTLHPILCKVANDKAADMINRSYYAHVDPSGFGINHYIHKAGYSIPLSLVISNPAANNFESIAPSLGSEAATMLINSPAHRQHVLGLDFWKSCTDAGIACVKSPRWFSTTKTYTVVIIASHFNT